MSHEEQTPYQCASGGNAGTGTDAAPGCAATNLQNEQSASASDCAAFSNERKTELVKILFSVREKIMRLSEICALCRADIAKQKERIALNPQNKNEYESGQNGIDAGERVEKLCFEALERISHHAGTLIQVARGNKRADAGCENFLDLPEVLSTREEEEREMELRRGFKVNAAQV